MYFNKQILSFTVMLAVVLAGFTACDTTNSNETNNSNGRFAVQLTDAPANYDAVFIDIQEVRIKSADFNEEDPENGEGDKDDEWVTLSNDPVRVDLLELRNGATIQLGDEEVEAGEYNQIRLILGPDNAVVIDGETFDLKTPSAQQSGLKLNIDAEVEDGEIYNLLVDFDAGRSIVETGNGMYILKPVLRAVELGETGSIRGTVQPDSVQTSVMAIANGDTLSTLTDEEGEYTIIGVTSGTYEVVFNPSDDAFTDTTVTDVTVGVDEDIEMETVTLSKK